MSIFKELVYNFAYEVHNTQNASAIDRLYQHLQDVNNWLHTDGTSQDVRDYYEVLLNEYEAYASYAQVHPEGIYDGNRLSSFFNSNQDDFNYYGHSFGEDALEPHYNDYYGHSYGEDAISA